MEEELLIQEIFICNKETCNEENELVWENVCWSGKTCHMLLQLNSGKRPKKMKNQVGGLFCFFVFFGL